MKVALLGAPGAGKTKIARRVVKRLNAESKDWTVIDGYVEKLRERTGHPYGGQSDFHHTLQIIAERWILEDNAGVQQKHSITCGSIYETIIYASNRAMAPALNERGMVEDQVYAQTMMHALGALEARTFDYDAIFWIPRSTDNPATPDTWDAVVDAKLPEVLDGFFKYAMPLIGTDKEKVERATDVITLIQSETAKTEQPTV